MPDARKVHTEPVPKVGGLAMAIGALVPVVLVADGGRFVNSVLIGACVIVLFGLVDDLKNLGWKAKFAGQIAAALIVILYGKLNICYLGSCLPDGVSLPEVLALPITMVVIVGVTNAINLSDGLDGLAGGTSLFIFLCIGIVCYTGGDFPEKLFIMLLCTAMIGAIFGFLRFNTYPATVFMGDTGSQLLGFLAVTLSLGVTQRETPLSPLLPLLLLGFPVLDTLTVMVERIAAGRMPFSPDKNHFHHKLMRLGLFHTEAVVTIYGITALLTAAAYLLRYHSDWLLLSCYAAFCALVVLDVHGRRAPRVPVPPHGVFRHRDQGPAENHQGQEPADPGLLPAAAVRAAAAFHSRCPGAGRGPRVSLRRGRGLCRRYPHRPADAKGVGEQRPAGGLLPDGADGAEPGATWSRPAGSSRSC